MSGRALQGDSPSHNDVIIACLVTSLSCQLLSGREPTSQGFQRGVCVKFSVQCLSHISHEMLPVQMLLLIMKFTMFLFLGFGF